jgi:hypothetical protein
VIAGTLDRALRAPARGDGRGLRGLLASLPDRLVIAVAAVFFVVATLAAFGLMYSWLAVPLIVIAVVATWWLAPDPLAPSRRTVGFALVAIGVAIIWFLINVPFVTEFVVASRDPGIYLLSGATVAQNGNVVIDVANAERIAATIDGLSARLDAFGSSDGETVRLQGSSGLPALLALGYWVGGIGAATYVNLLVGAVGLLAVYGLGRRVLGAGWALVPMALLGASMPYIHLSRSTYTEIAATLLMAAGATWTIGAFRRRSIRDFAVAGALVGAAGITRIDGALGTLGMLAGFVLVLIGIGAARRDAPLRVRALVAMGAAAVMLGLGVADLVINVPRYVNDLGEPPRQLWAATAAVALVMIVLCLSPLGRRVSSPPWMRKPAARVFAILAAAFFVYLLSRPWWFVSRFSDPEGAYGRAIVGMQAADGLPIEPGRSYDEYSLWWYGWYFGWPLVILAGIGLALWLYWAVSRRRAAHVVVLATLAVTAFLYLNRIAITPDQVWAFRRVLPVITPGLLIAAVIPIRMLAARPGPRRVTAVAAVVVTVLCTLFPWGRIFFQPEGSGQVREITAICDAAGDAGALALVSPGAPPNYALSVKTVCGKDTLVIADPVGVDWGRLAEIEGGVAVVTFDVGAVPWRDEPTEPLVESVVYRWQRHLLQVPRSTWLDVREVYVGTVAPDGTVVATR